MEINKNEFEMYDKYIGHKFYRYDDEGNATILRLNKVDHGKNELRFFVEGRPKHVYVPYESFVKLGYRRLAPDGMLCASIVKMKDNFEDVIVTLGRLDPKYNDNAIPFAVCRQGLYDVFTNGAKKSDTVNYIGLSISKDTCHTEEDLSMALSCEGVKHTTFIGVYLDDNLKTILKFIRKSKFDKCLKNLFDSYERLNERLLNEGKAIYAGHCSSLEQLLVSNNFMHDFRSAFGIKELPFDIPEDAEYLDAGNAEFLARELNIKISRTYVLKYSKEYDMSKINRDYVLASTPSDNYGVYIVGYDLIDED